MKLKRLFCILTAISLLFAGCAEESVSSITSSSAEEESTDISAEIIADLYVYSSSSENADILYNIDVTSAPYNADNTGEADAASAIQKALDDVAFTYGGGTVFLPKGEYLLTKRLFMREGVTLRGEYSPDATSGTVLMVKTDYRYNDKMSVIQLCSSSAVEGVSVYYPDQNINDVQDFYYTFDTKGDTTSATLRNINLINSYCGILLSKETGDTTTLCNIENVQGTVLYQGFASHRDADIGFCDKLKFSPTYWASLGEKFNAPKETEIRKYMKSISSVGFILRDLDRACLSNCLADGFDIGIFNPVMTAAGLSGSYYNFDILNARVGIEANGIDTRYGLNLTQSNIEASEASIINHTKTTGNTTDGEYPYISLCDSLVSGKTQGFVCTVNGGDTDYTERGHAYTMPTVKTVFNAVKEFGADNQGAQNASDKIQNALDAANTQGGGIVYLPAGKYLLEAPITVYKNTLLVGAMQNTVNSSAYGTKLYITYGLSLGGDSSVITLSGDGASMVGFTVVYPSNSPTDENFKSFDDDSAFTIKATGISNSIYAICFVNTGRGIYLSDATDFAVSYIYGTFWTNGITAENSKGIIYRLHSNVTYNRNLKNNDVLFSDWLNETHTVYGEEMNPTTILLDLICGRDLTFLNLKNSDVQVRDAFHYGANRYCVSDASTVLNINGEAGRLYTSGENYTLKNGSSVVHINAVCRIFDNLLANEGGSFTMYNLSVANDKQQTVIK